MFSISNIVSFIFVLLWSSAFITSKIIIDNATPFLSLSFRFIIVALFFFLFYLIFSKKNNFTLRSIFDASISGILFHGFYLGGVFYSLHQGASASLIGLIVSLQPILTSVLAKNYLNENLSKLQWGGIILGFFGAVLVIVTDLNNNLSLVAFFAGIIGLLSSSLGIIWQKKIETQLSLSSNNFIQALSASIFHFIISILFEDYFINFNTSFILAMTWQIFAISLGAFLILMWLLQKNKASETSTLFFLVAPVSAMMAYIILDETFILLDILGLIICSIGVFIVTKYKTKT